MPARLARAPSLLLLAAAHVVCYGRLRNPLFGQCYMGVRVKPPSATRRRALHRLYRGGKVLAYCRASARETHSSGSASKEKPSALRHALNARKE